MGQAHFVVSLRRHLLVALLVLSWAPSPTYANPAATANGKSGEVDSEDIFGFTSGTDLAELGQKAGEIRSVGRFDKRDGSYSALANALAFKYMAFPETRLTISGVTSYHDISGVTGFDDRHQLAFQGFASEIKHRFLDRSKAPFGLAVSAEPRWNRIDEASGERVTHYGATLTIAADKELITGTLFGAFNVLYDLGSTRVQGEAERERDSTIGFASALTVQVLPGRFIGVEGRYFRKYEGLGLDALVGESIFHWSYFQCQGRRMLFPCRGLEHSGLGTRGRNRRPSRPRQLRTASSPPEIWFRVLTLASCVASFLPFRDRVRTTVVLSACPEVF